MGDCINIITFSLPNPLVRLSNLVYILSMLKTTMATGRLLGLTGLSLGAGALGQGLLRLDWLWPGLLLLAGSALLLVLAAHNAGREEAGGDDPYLGLDRPLHIRPGLPGILGLAALAGALAFSAMAYRAFSGPGTAPQAWNLYLGSLILLLSGALLLAGAPLLGRGGPFRRLWPESLSGRLLLLLILLMAVFLRLWRLDVLPYGVWYDEAISGLQAVRWNQEAAFRPQFADNNPGQLIALYAASLRWLGQDVQSLRLVQAVLGVGGVLAAYLFGRELRGPGFGMTLGFFTASARWHLNFSRIAMPGVDTPLFVFLSLFFLLRLLRGGRLRDALWAGLSLGLGLSVYSSFRLYLLALAAFTILALLLWRGWAARLWDGRWRLRMSARLAAIGLALWLAALPAVHFAWTQPDSFWGRVQTTSIFNNREEPDLGRALWNTTRSHLLMFNYRGDHNARHNLPGEPALDPVMGVLFALGLGLALARARRPANLFFLILLPTGLLGGVLSLDFEAPQSLRSIGALPAVLYFCTLAFATLVRLAGGALDRWTTSGRTGSSGAASSLNGPASIVKVRAGWRVIPALALGGYIVFFNAQTYFVRQAQDFAVWNAFTTAESIVGMRMARLGPDYVFYLSPFFANQPSIRFLSPETPDQRLLALPDPLPLRQPADRPAALFIHPDEAWVVEAARELYPNGEFETIHDPGGNIPVAYQVILSREDLASIQGVELRYWAGQTWEGLPQAALHTETIDLSWSEEQPPLVDSTGQEGDFAAEWESTLYAPEYGTYTLILRAPAEACLAIDGAALVSLPEAGGEGAASLALAQGNHRLRVRARLPERARLTERGLAGEGEVRLQWQPPGGSPELIPQWALYLPPVRVHGLQGSYYPNAAWEGEPSLVRIDPILDMYFHLTPLPRPYSVEWTGTLEAPETGEYALGLRAVDEAALFLDGELVLETTSPDRYREAVLALDRGPHDLKLRFKDATGRSRIHLWWRPPGGELQIIPAEYLHPPAPEGDDQGCTGGW
jgi:hypothetical protein